MYRKRIHPTDRPAGSSVHESESESVRLSLRRSPRSPSSPTGIQDRRPRHSKHPSLLAMRAVFSVFSTNVGRFPELTPVRRQANRGWLPTPGAGDMGGVAFQGRRVSHSSGGGVVLAVHVVAEAGMLEGVLTFGTMDK